MKSTVKRVLLVLLAGVMILSVISLVACNKNPSEDDKKPDDDKKDDDGPTEEQRIPLEGIPDTTYDDAQFHVLEWSANGVDTPGQGWIPWEEIDVQDYSGEAIDRAVYDRNRAIEEKYGVKITAEYVSVDQGYDNKLRNSVNNQDNLYQLMTLRTGSIVGFAQEGLLADLNSLDYLHLDQPWWTQDSIDKFTTGKSLFFASSEMLLRDKGATATMYFNKKIAEDNAESVGDLYALVDNKEWTFENMLDIASLVAHDMDGDLQVSSENDMWGIVGQDDPVYFMFCGAGYLFGNIDNEGHVVNTFGEGDSVETLMDIFDEMMYSDFYYKTGKDADLFKANHALFLSRMIKVTANNLRDMESDYGILPTPKWDDSQENYHSLVWIHHDSVLGIPVSDDMDMAAIITEVMSWESYYSVYPKFYDTVLMNRSTRDPESKRMLEIVFQTRTWDPGEIWDTKSGFHGGEGILRLSGTGSSDIASLWKRYETAVLNRFETINDWIDTLS